MDLSLSQRDLQWYVTLHLNRIKLSSGVSDRYVGKSEKY